MNGNRRPAQNGTATTSPDKETPQINTGAGYGASWPALFAELDSIRRDLIAIERRAK